MHERNDRELDEERLRLSENQPYRDLPALLVKDLRRLLRQICQQVFEQVTASLGVRDEFGPIG
jgi:hypothetical protein